MDSNNIVIRPGIPDDFNFVISTWLKCYRHSSTFTKHVKSTIFFLWHQRVIKRILSRPQTKVLVACEANDPSLILGYLVCESQDVSVLHFIYVKKAFRKFGIGKELFQVSQSPSDSEFTHHTFDMEWVTQKYPNLVYNLYRI